MILWNGACIVHETFSEKELIKLKVRNENAKIIDGDQIIAMIAKRWKLKKILKGGVIGTLMSNFGLEQFLKNEKIRFFLYYEKKRNIYRGTK